MSEAGAAPARGPRDLRRKNRKLWRPTDAKIMYEQSAIPSMSKTAQERRTGSQLVFAKSKSVILISSSLTVKQPLDAAAEVSNMKLILDSICVKKLRKLLQRPQRATALQYGCRWLEKSKVWSLDHNSRDSDASARTENHSQLCETSRTAELWAASEQQDRENKNG